VCGGDVEVGVEVENVEVEAPLALAISRLDVICILQHFPV
jgi:hypothetical protein